MSPFETIAPRAAAYVVARDEASGITRLSRADGDGVGVLYGPLVNPHAADDARLFTTGPAARDLLVKIHDTLSTLFDDGDEERALLAEIEAHLVATDDMPVRVVDGDDRAPREPRGELLSDVVGDDFPLFLATAQALRNGTGEVVIGGGAVPAFRLTRV